MRFLRSESLRSMHIPNVITAGLAAAAAFQGARVTRAAPEAPGVFPLEHICNRGSPVPGPLLKALGRNYAACLASRMFSSLTPHGERVLCFGYGAIEASFRATLDEAVPSDIPVLREGLHRMHRSRAANPLGSPATAGHSAKKLRRQNFHDYRNSGSGTYTRGVDTLVGVLRLHVPVEQRSSLEAARRAVRSLECSKALNAAMPRLVRAEIAERRTQVTLREIRNPESISAGEADALRADLAAMRFGDSPIKQRMREDALVALVKETPTDQRSVATR
ncbi:MAG: hypothetical protein ACREPC_08675 [Stenotrophomonas sp.]